MQRQRAMRMNFLSLEKKGFTLIEMVVVVVIIGILATMGLAKYNRTVEKSRAAEGVNILSALRQAQLAYYLEYDTFRQEGAWNSPNGLPINITGAKYFQWCPTGPWETYAPNSVARVLRLDGSYNLKIRENGTIVCWEGTSNGCTNAGFDTGVNS